MYLCVPTSNLTKNVKIKKYWLRHVDREVGDARVVGAAVLLDGEAVAGEPVGQHGHERAPAPVRREDRRRAVPRRQRAADLPQISKIQFPQLFLATDFRCQSFKLIQNIAPTNFKYLATTWSREQMVRGPYIVAEPFQARGGPKKKKPKKPPERNLVLCFKP
jgi:hypothetical protein